MPGRLPHRPGYSGLPAGHAGGRPGEGAADYPGTEPASLHYRDPLPAPLRGQVHAQLLRGQPADPADQAAGSRTRI